MRNGQQTIPDYPEDGQPLVAWKRGDFVEGLHRGSIAVVSSDGRLLHAAGHPHSTALLRSCAKPFQLITVLETGAADRFGFNASELAVAAASHNGESVHLETVRGMLAKIGLGEERLRCGVHPPYAGYVAESMWREGRAPSPLSNNCSGKHTAMLAACLMRGWPLDSYESTQHPLQIANRRSAARFAGLEAEALGIGIDGCTVPTFAMPLSAAARAFARIADPANAPEGDAEHAQRIFAGMNAHPVLGSGSIGRLEAALMTLFPGEVIAKVGAEAMFCVGIAPGILDERGVGVAIKLGDGITFNRAVDGVVVETLRQIGLLEDDHLLALGGYLPRSVGNCRGDEVGQVEYRFELV